MTEADKYIRRLDKGGEDWSNDNRMLSDALQDFADEQVREELLNFSRYYNKEATCLKSESILMIDGHHIIDYLKSKV